jgi:maltose O-acetyltransferase
MEDNFMLSRLRRLFKRLILRKSKEQLELEYLIQNGLKIGNNTHINSGFLIDSKWPWLISIGDNVLFSSNVTILAHDASTNIVGCQTKLGRVVIGNNVFVGYGSTILCNVRIGDNVVIGAGSVVSHDLESGGVYAGIPAKRICSIEEYRKKNEALLTNRPYFASIHKWNEWGESTESERQQMIDALEDGCGYI